MNNLILTSIPFDELVSKLAEAVKQQPAPEPTPAVDNNELLKIDEVCKMLNVSKVTVFTWKKEGKIPFHRLGNRVYYKRAEIINSLKAINKEERCK